MNWHCLLQCQLASHKNKLFSVLDRDICMTLFFDLQLYSEEAPAFSRWIFFAGSCTSSSTCRLRTKSSARTWPNRGSLPSLPSCRRGTSSHTTWSSVSAGMVKPPSVCATNATWMWHCIPIFSESEATRSYVGFLCLLPCNVIKVNTKVVSDQTLQRSSLMRLCALLVPKRLHSSWHNRCIFIVGIESWTVFSYRCQCCCPRLAGIHCILRVFFIWKQKIKFSECLTVVTFWILGGLIPKFLNVH